MDADTEDEKMDHIIDVIFATICYIASVTSLVAALIESLRGVSSFQSTVVGLLFLIVANQIGNSHGNKLLSKR